jgi:hypothetical protein
VAENCASAQDAFGIYDVPELVAWFALTEAVGHNRTQEYLRALAVMLANRAKQPANESASATEVAVQWWRRGAAYSALSMLGEQLDHWSPFNVRRAARGHEQIFMALQLGEGLHGIFVPTPNEPGQPTALTAEIRAAFSHFVGDFAKSRDDDEMRRRNARAVTEAAKKQFGLIRNGEPDQTANNVLNARNWAELLSLTGVAEAPNMPLDELLARMEGLRDLLLVRTADVAVRGDHAFLGLVGQGLDRSTRGTIDYAIELANTSLALALEDAALEGLRAAAVACVRAGGACALRAALVQAAVVTSGTLTIQRAVNSMRWSIETGERLETWGEAEGDVSMLQQFRRMIRTPIDTRETLRPGSPDAPVVDTAATTDRPTADPAPDNVEP